MTAIACALIYILFIAFISLVAGPQWRRLNSDEPRMPTARQKKQWRKQRMRWSPKLVDRIK